MVYIGMDREASPEPGRRFTGLETPPPVAGDTPGRSFVLSADGLGSLDVGSPVYYRRVQVGRMTSYQLDEDGKSVKLQIFIDTPNDRFVTAHTRFWNVSGVDVSLGADGFRLKTQSIATIVSGGIAFATPEYAPDDPAAESAQYVLASDQASAMAPPDGPAQYIQLRFDQSLRGLSVGAPVLFSGVDLGKVVSTTLDYDAPDHRFPTVVGIEIYPQRLGRVLKKLQKPDADPRRQIVRLIGELVAHGLRAQVRSANLLTGQLYVSIEYVSDAPAASFDESARSLTLPTVSGSLDRLEERLASIVGKIDGVPLESIGKNLDVALLDLNKLIGRLDRTLKQLDEQVLPEAAQTLQRVQQTLGTAEKTLSAAEGMLAEDAPLQHDLVQTLREAQRAARSLRVLTDLLGRHPESLLRGRPGDPPGVPEESPTPERE